MSRYFYGADIQKQLYFVPTHRNPKKARGKAAQHAHEETNIPWALSLPFSHDTVAPWEALGYNLSFLAHGQMVLLHTTALSSS